MLITKKTSMSNSNHRKKLSIYIPIIIYRFESVCKVSIPYAYLHTDLIQYVNRQYIRIFSYVRTKVITYRFNSVCK